MDQAQIDAARYARALEIAHTPVEALPAEQWDTDGLRAEFEILAFSAPFVVARRLSTGELGSLEFKHSPRVYFNWQVDRP